MVGASSCSAWLRQVLRLLSLCCGLCSTVLLHREGTDGRGAAVNLQRSDKTAQGTDPSGVDHRGPSWGAPDPEEALAAAAKYRLQLSKPLKWMHVPKSGTSFLNSLIHLPTICPSVKPDFAVDRKHCKENSIDFEVGFDVLCKEKCPGLACPWNSQLHHEAAGDDWESVYNRHAVAMFRQPEQRALSAYHDPEWRWNGWPRELFNNTDPESALQFAKGTRGCVTKMLTRKERDACQRLPFDSSEEEVRLAKQRLRDGFVFVGIVEEWELSMCLLHKMLGGKCKGVELLNNRPGINGQLQPYDLSVLGDFRDHADREVYKEARVIFHENLKKFDVSRSSCTACFQEAAREIGRSPGPDKPCTW